MFTYKHIHRHIGGLENDNTALNCLVNIHRHIGGLEIIYQVNQQCCNIHRHIGGLEMSNESDNGA